MTKPPAGSSWRYVLVTVHEDQEEHHDLTLQNELRPRHEFSIEHRGKVERVRVEAVEPTGIAGVDARITARVMA